MSTRRPDRPPHRKWPWVLGISLVAVLALATGYLFYFTSMLSVKTVSVAGASPAVEQQVREQLQPEVGIQLARVDTSELGTTIATIPDVAGATVERAWPDALKVTITQRVAVAVTMANDAWYSLDASGVPFSPVKTKPASLTQIELATPGSGDPSTTAALAVLGALPRSVLSSVSKIRAASPFRVELLLTGNRTVIWGDASSSARKAQVLPVMLQQKGSVFDLSDPSLVSVR